MEYSPNNELNLLNISDSKEELDQPRISMFNPTNKIYQPIPKQKRRLCSVPLKAFKVTCPSKSEMLSIICDNIFEDQVINEYMNLSMFKLKSRIKLNNTFKSKNNKIDNNNSQSKDQDNNIINIKEENEDLEEIPQESLQHKKSFIFNNLFKIKNIKCPRLLEEQWKYEKILLDYNIIDFTSKKIFFYFNIFFD